MSLVNSQEVKQLLTDQYNFLIKKYGNKRVLGIFTYGLYNYNLAEDISEVKTVACLFPTFEQLCCLESPLETFYLTDDKERAIRCVDIRLAYQSIINQESIVLEAVFSKEKILNPRFEKDYNYYLDANKETIFHSNQQLRVKQAIMKGKQSLSIYEKTGDRKLLLHASGVRIAVRQYLNGVSCANCVDLKQDYYRNYLLQIKHGEKTPDSDEIEEDFTSLLEDSFYSTKKNENNYNILKEGLVNIIKVALTDMAQEVNFEELLTTTEQKALKIVIEHLENGHQGNISISQLVANSSISRPVFKNLIQKMKDNSVAEIENQGVKGTYIKIIDGHLLSKKF